MRAEEILKSEDFKRCEAFHGHVCPGLSIGYRAAKTAMEWLSESRSEDEEIVAIVETDACSADAVQVLTGCTFGKGNFIYRDYGKMALTLLSRSTGSGVRVALRSDAIAQNEEQMSLMQKIQQGDATEADRKRFSELHFKKTCDVLEMPVNRLFTITPTVTELPPRAHVELSESCARCGEPTMPSKMERAGTEKICRECAAKSS